MTVRVSTTRLVLVQIKKVRLTCV